MMLQSSLFSEDCTPLAENVEDVRKKSNTNVSPLLCRLKLRLLRSADFGVSDRWCRGWGESDILGGPAISSFVAVTRFRIWKTGFRIGKDRIHDWASPDSGFGESGFRIRRVRIRLSIRWKQCLQKSKSIAHQMTKR